MENIFWIVESVLKCLGITIGALLGVAYLTVAERKYLSSIQRRRGPNVIGFYGLLQAIGDGVKLLLKETTKPTSAESVIYIIAPCITFTVAFICWSVIPFGEGVVLSDIGVGVLYIMAVSSIGVYGIIMGGWSSNSKYGFMGSMRSTAQMISYEVSIGFVIVTVVLYSGGTANLSEIVLNQERMWNIVGLFPMFIVFVILIIAETNRHPFDLPEAEAELVSGYNVEYSAGGFVLFFLGEYCSMIVMSSLCTVLFLGGWNGTALLGGGVVMGIIMFSIKTFIMTCVFIWARAAYPRYRYDQLMSLGWKSFLPISMGWVVLVSGVCYAI